MSLSSSHVQVDVSVFGPVVLKVGELPRSWSSVPVFVDEQAGIRISKGGGLRSDLSSASMLIFEYEKLGIRCEYGLPGTRDSTGPFDVEFASAVLSRVLSTMSGTQLHDLLVAVNEMASNKGVQRGMREVRLSIKAVLDL